jgi:hypothetical protein
MEQSAIEPNVGQVFALSRQHRRFRSGLSFASVFFSDQFLRLRIRHGIAYIHPSAAGKSLLLRFGY